MSELEPYAEACEREAAYELKLLNEGEWPAFDFIAAMFLTAANLARGCCTGGEWE